MSSIVIPTDPTGLEEMLNNTQRMGEVLRDPPRFQEFINNYATMTLSTKLGQDIQDNVKSQTEAVMIKWLRDNEVENVRALNLDPNSRRQVPKATLFNPEALGAQADLDRCFTSKAEFFHAISDRSFKNADRLQKIESLRNAMSSLSPSDGGFLVPETLRAEMLQVALETAIVRSRARVIPMDAPKVSFPTIDSTSNVSSVHGGIIGYWTEEGATLTESNPRFGRVVLDAHKLTLYTEVPSELVQDARPALTAFIDQIFPEALAWFEDVAFFLGGGVGEPLGFLNAPATIATDRVGSSTDTVVWADIVGMYARMLPQSLNRAVWIVSPEVLPQLLTMTVGSGNAAVWIGGGNFPSGAASPPMTMLGRPLIVSEKARQLGTQGDINFVDFGFYLIGDRQAMSARQSEDYRFKNDITAFRVIERLDGRPWLTSAITPQNNGDTLSPFVSLAD